MTLLSSTLANASRQPFVLLQSSIAQPCLPVLVNIVASAGTKSKTTLLFCVLYPPRAFGENENEHLRIFDWTGRVPGYDAEDFDPREHIIGAINSEPDGPLDVIIDSVDTLLSDIGSLAKTQLFLLQLYAAVRQRGNSARLILHILAPSPLLPVLTQTKLSPTLTHITAHPPVLLTHLAAEYLTPPPPLSPPGKFWSVFAPIAGRHAEAEALVYGQGGEGSAGREVVLEVLVRGADGSSRRRGVERVLEGWASGQACELTGLETLKSLFTKKAVEENGPDPTQNLPFNLNLTSEQQQARAQVPLPYAHDGKVSEPPPMAQGAILYDPDSADDLDDDDPDEDLDI